MKRIAFAAVLVGLTLVGSVALAQYQPGRDIWYSRHPNLARAQDLISQAYGSIQAARQANEYQLNGHAARAEQLLDAANRELKLAAETSNAEGR
ncbi:hypothetical protein [Dyella acidisoli]|uniref:DUF4398 domain-containing protein n=1 Tax=Dyella acidisoli TaxID=1867834 RepID=A0ABQ5XN21_9GAMM|nr:hypothetical protein [Dyella acidisoli]GLQ93104.1 hypothetical protein GCM10007901_20550 [Dyella acidisoli]